MVRHSILILVISVLGASGTARADTIHLKNGQTIVADAVREKNGRVEYDIGDNTYAILKASVERIETGGATPAMRDKAELPSISVKAEVPRSDELLGKLIHDGRLDTDMLASIERENNSARTAAAFFVAARFEDARGNPDKARTYLERARSFEPENAAILDHYAALLLRAGRFAEALPLAEKAARIEPNSADAFMLLGYADFQTGRTQAAVRAWKRSLEIQPSPEVEQMLSKGERELNAESSYRAQESNHFTLKYEGKQTSDAFRHDLLVALESHYQDLGRDLGLLPRENINVVLYTSQAFFDVTQAPSWTSAVNDGKLRIPVEGLTAVTPELSRVMKHELAHSFINQITKGRCPQWLNEGVAQLLEPKDLGVNGTRLAKLFAAGQQIPLNQLEGSFMRFSAPEAVVAYAESLAAMAYVRDTYGVSDVARVLVRIGEGQSTEAALRTTIHAGYPQLEQEVGQYLRRTYGE